MPFPQTLVLIGCFTVFWTIYYTLEVYLSQRNVAFHPVCRSGPCHWPQRSQKAKEEGIVVLDNGVMYRVLEEGHGTKKPTPRSIVYVHYTGRLIDGTVFDASAKHGDKPAEFMPTQVIRGWTEALTMMPVGSKWRLFIPSDLAYGDRDQGQIKPYSTLIFDVELVEIVKK